MRLPAAYRRAKADFNMTPMIDVVFLLIVFFLVSSHLAKQEVQLELDLPSAESGHDSAADDRVRVTVNVLPQGQILLAGTPVGAKELTNRLQFEASRSGHGLEVRIRGDRNVSYRHVEPILLACARASIWNVTFAVTRKGR